MNTHVNTRFIVSRVLSYVAGAWSYAMAIYKMFQMIITRIKISNARFFDRR
jgi:hypothetical protein